MNAFGNLLNLAFSLIPSESVQYLKFTGNNQSEIGLDSPQYADPIVLPASVQAVSNDTYSQLQLDLSKNYRRVFLPANAAGVDQMKSSDVLIFQGRRWNVVSTDDWYKYDGWNSVIVAEDKEY